MPEDGAFKTEYERNGHWPDWKQMLAESVNESYRFRAAYLALTPTDGDYTFDPSEYEFVDPVTAAKRSAGSAVEEEQARIAREQFESDIGFA